jgi:hypothetical protein
MVGGMVETLPDLAVSIWTSPWKHFGESELFRNWGELVLVGVFLALCLFWMLMDRKTSLRFWLGVLAVAVGVKLVVDDGPIAHTVTDSALALPRAARHLFR